MSLNILASLIVNTIFPATCAARILANVSVPYSAMNISCGISFAVMKPLSLVKSLVAVGISVVSGRASTSAAVNTTAPVLLLTEVTGTVIPPTAVST